MAQRDSNCPRSSFRAAGLSLKTMSVIDRTNHPSGSRREGNRSDAPSPGAVRRPRESSNSTGRPVRRHGYEPRVPACRRPDRRRCAAVGGCLMVGTRRFDPRAGIRPTSPVSRPVPVLTAPPLNRPLNRSRPRLTAETTEEQP